MSMKAKMLRALGGVLLKEARIIAAENVSEGFRRLVLRGENVAPPEPGAKLQILVSEDEVRTYTPIASGEEFVLLGWRHAGGPGAAWIGAATVGEVIRFVGPQRSLVLPAGPVIVVGDETSVAVAASFEVARPGKVRGIFSVREPDATRAAAQTVGLAPDRVHASPSKDLDTVVDAVVAARAAHADAVVALTGAAELVIAARAALRARGVDNLKTKTYWIPGRAGLD